MEVEKGGTAATVIDVTPTWSGTLGMILALLTKGTAEARAVAEGELRRMALLADIANDVQGGLIATREMMGPEGEALTGGDVSRQLDALLLRFKPAAR